MDTHALLKKYILERLRRGEIAAEDIGKLKRSFDLTGIVSNTQLSRALRSLCYKDREIKILRPIEEPGDGSASSVRSFLIKLA